MKEEKIKKTISATSIATYNRCPLQYYYKYILELLEPHSQALETGTKVHKLIEDFNNGKDIQDDGSEEYKMFLVYKNSPLEGNIISNEREFKVDIGDGFSLTGKIDREDDDKTVDYKTSSKDYKQEDVQQIQSRIYPYERYLSTGNIFPMYYYIINKKKYNKVGYTPQVLKAEYTKEEIIGVKEELEEFKKELLKQKYSYNDGPWCYFCPYGPKGTKNCHK